MALTFRQCLTHSRLTTSASAAPPLTVPLPSICSDEGVGQGRGREAFPTLSHDRAPTRDVGAGQRGCSGGGYPARDPLATPLEGGGPDEGVNWPFFSTSVCRLITGVTLRGCRTPTTSA